MHADCQRNRKSQKFLCVFVRLMEPLHLYGQRCVTPLLAMTAPHLGPSTYAFLRNEFFDLLGEIWQKIFRVTRAKCLGKFNVSGILANAAFPRLHSGKTCVGASGWWKLCWVDLWSVNSLKFVNIFRNPVKNTILSFCIRSWLGKSNPSNKKRGNR